MLYSREDCALFLLALILLLCGLALLDFILESHDRRKAEERQRRFRDLNRHNDLRLRHRVYLAQMGAVLESIGRKGA